PRPSPPAGDNAWPASRSTRIWSWCSLIALLLSIRHVEFGLEQRSEVRGAGARLLLAGELLHGLGILRHVPGLDRKIDRAVLAVDVDDHRRYRIAFLEPRADVVDPLARDLRGAEIALDVVLELDHRALGIDRLHRTGDDGILLV